MSVRKQHWKTRKGEERSAWVATYTDAEGKRRAKFFERKKDADAYHDKVKLDVREGVHTPPSKSPTVKEAAEDWLRYVKLEKREAATVYLYRQYAQMHIIPRIGRVKLSSLTHASIERFKDDLLDPDKNPVASHLLAKRVLGALKAILKDAKRRGKVAQNVAQGVEVKIDGRSKRKLQTGVDIPSRDEIRRLIEGAPDGWVRAFVTTAAFSGLRASELRGLRWEDVDLAHGKLHIRQRADRYNAMGRPKSAAGERQVPVGPMVINALRQWQTTLRERKLKRKPRADLDLVFPTATGAPMQRNNIVTRHWLPLQIKAGVVTKSGKAKYPGLHSLRHFYASWCINRRQDGGLELPAKTVQTRLGHASIVMTLNTYAHLFPSDDGAELEAAEKAIFAAS